MTKLQSLKQDLQFKEILRKKRLTSNYFTVYFMKNFNEKIKNKNLNISFVTKKKIGNAVKRNKIKRRLRNIMNDVVKNIYLNLNYSYLLITKKFSEILLIFSSCVGSMTSLLVLLILLLILNIDFAICLSSAVPLGVLQISGLLSRWVVQIFAAT